MLWLPCTLALCLVLEVEVEASLFAISSTIPTYNHIGHKGMALPIQMLLQCNWLIDFNFTHVSRS